MRLLGFDFNKAVQIYKAARAIQRTMPAGLSSVNSYSWLTNLFAPVHEAFTGAWQRNIVLDTGPSLLAFSAVFACVTGIASDVSKMRIKLSEDIEGIWTEVTKNAPWLKVLRKPNHYQNRIQFIQQWVVSLLLYGNAYILKQREDGRGIVTAMYVLNPQRVKPMVAEDGSVWYELQTDYLSQVDDDYLKDLPQSPMVPASEIIHDRMVCLWHPLIGVPPIFACGASATMGNRIQTNSTTFFQNMSRPGGLLSAPGKIEDPTAKRLKEYWEQNFGGQNVGRIAVLGDGLKFEAMTMPAETAQLIEQLRWTVEDVARCFHYPMSKLGGPMPTYDSLEAVTMAYYTDCLQMFVENIEICMDEGLELPAPYGTEFELENLVRMDTNALYDSNNKASSWMKINEMRFRANFKPLPIGGDTVYRQEQDHSIEAIAKRDKEDPFPKAPPPAPAPEPEPEEEPAKSIDPDYLAWSIERTLRKELALATA